VATPNSAQLWNNVGLCFFAKQKPVPVCRLLRPEALLPHHHSVSPPPTTRTFGALGVLHGARNHGTATMGACSLSAY